MKHRRVLYLICLLVVLGVNIFYVEYQIFMLLVLMIVLPLISWIMFMISYINLGMSLQVDSNIVTEGSSVRIRLVKKNMLNLSFVNADMSIKYTYISTGDELRKNVTRINGLGKYAGKVELPASFCGNISIGVDVIDIYDYLGFFHIRKKFKGMTKVCIMPKSEASDIQDIEGAYSEIDNEELRFRGAGDEVTELREYRDGDSPRNIHWKRSSTLPEDDFIVKEYDLDVYRTVFLVIDIDASKSKQPLEHMSRIYRAAFCKGLGLVHNNAIGEYVVWDGVREDIVRLKFYDDVTCIQAMKKVMEYKCFEDAAAKACQAIYADSTIELTSQPVVITDNEE